MSILAVILAIIGMYVLLNDGGNEVLTFIGFALTLGAVVLGAVATIVTGGW